MLLSLLKVRNSKKAYAERHFYTYALENQRNPYTDPYFPRNASEVPGNRMQKLIPLATLQKNQRKPCSKCHFHPQVLENRWK
jgi:hypothetical protein